MGRLSNRPRIMLPPRDTLLSSHPGEILHVYGHGLLGIPSRGYHNLEL